MVLRGGCFLENDKTSVARLVALGYEPCARISSPCKQYNSKVMQKRNQLLDLHSIIRALQLHYFIVESFSSQWENPVYLNICQQVWVEQKHACGWYPSYPRSQPFSRWVPFFIFYGASQFSVQCTCRFGLNLVNVEISWWAHPDNGFDENICAVVQAGRKEIFQPWSSHYQQG